MQKKENKEQYAVSVIHIRLTDEKMDKPCQSLPPAVTNGVQLHAMARRATKRQDRQRKRKPDDTEALAVSITLPAVCLRMAIARCGHCCADNQKLITWPLSMPDAYAISCVRMHCSLQRKPEMQPPKGPHTGKVTVGESNQRGSSDGFGLNCDNGEKLRATFVPGYCDREALHRAVSTGGYVQDVIPAVKRRSGSRLPASPVEWLTDSGSACRYHQTRQFDTGISASANQQWVK